MYLNSWSLVNPKFGVAVSFLSTVNIFQTDKGSYTGQYVDKAGAAAVA